MKGTYMTPMEEQRSDVGSALERLIFLSDGVFAIAMTLLVLEITVTDVSPGNLPKSLLDLTPRILTYALSFTIISIYWMTHQRIFHYIKRADNILIWLNVFFLMTIAFLPVPTNIIGSYGDQVPAVLFYIGSVTIGSFFIILLWQYATKDHRLVDKNLDSALIRHHARRSIIAPIIFLLSIALAFLNPYLAEASWLLIGVVILLHERLYRSHVATQQKQTKTV